MRKPKPRESLDVLAVGSQRVESVVSVCLERAEREPVHSLQVDSIGGTRRQRSTLDVKD